MQNSALAGIENRLSVFNEMMQEFLDEAKKDGIWKVEYCPSEKERAVSKGKIGNNDSSGPLYVLKILYLWLGKDHCSELAKDLNRGVFKYGKTGDLLLNLRKLSDQKMIDYKEKKEGSAISVSIKVNKLGVNILKELNIA